MEMNEGSSFSTEEEPVEEETEVRVKIRYSVFFDGTLNNRTNTEARENNTSAFQDHSGSDSYQNDLSNVAKMEPYIDASEGFDMTLKLYIEGAGTTDEGGDSTLGYALGQGSTGVKAKVGIGITKLNAAIRKNVENDAIIEELAFDIFGFSRGAAAARYFIYVLLSDVPIRRGRHTQPARPIYQRLEAAGYQISASRVKVRFVGLYDTVASEGINHSNDTYSLKLDSIGRSEVEQVVHLIASDEHRANFSLTNINSAAGKNKQVFLPGAHSDIGGGYRDDSHESLCLNESHNKKYLEDDRAQLIKWGYYREDEIWIESPPMVNPHGGMHGAPPLHSLLVARKGIRNHYDRIPLHIMADLACKAGMNIRNKINSVEKVPQTLASIFSDLKSYAEGEGFDADKWLSGHPYPWLADLRHDYMHFSAHLTRSAVVLKPHKPNLENGVRQRPEHDG